MIRSLSSLVRRGSLTQEPATAEVRLANEHDLEQQQEAAGTASNEGDNDNAHHDITQETDGMNQDLSSSTDPDAATTNAIVSSPESNNIEQENITEEPQNQQQEAAPQEDEPEEAQDSATQDSTTFEQLPKRRMLDRIAIVFVVLLVIGGIVAVSLVLTRQKRTGAVPAPSQTTPPPSPPLFDTQYLQDIRSILVPHELWTDTNSPQMRATEFMAASFPKIDTTSPRLYQRYAMLVLYFANGGERWPSFLDPSLHECNWSVVECNTNEEVGELRMSQQKMTGVLPQEIALLSHLQHLDLSQNRLEGTVPQGLYELTNLGT